jgi:hypothetical protein
MAVRLSAIHTSHPLPPGRFLVLMSVKRLSRHLGHSVAGRIMSVEKSSDLIVNWTRDHPACSIVSQPAALPHGPPPSPATPSEYVEVLISLKNVKSKIQWRSLFIGSKICLSAASKKADVSSPHSRHWIPWAKEQTQQRWSWSVSLRDMNSVDDQ